MAQVLPEGIGVRAGHGRVPRKGTSINEFYVHLPQHLESLVACKLRFLRLYFSVIFLNLTDHEP